MLVTALNRMVCQYCNNINKASSKNKHANPLCIRLQQTESTVGDSICSQLCSQIFSSPDSYTARYTEQLSAVVYWCLFFPAIRVVAAAGWQGRGGLLILFMALLWCLQAVGYYIYSFWLVWGGAILVRWRRHKGEREMLWGPQGWAAGTGQNWTVVA